ncbi:MAG: hypothetical protein ACRC0V_05990 [Fusobacteriaceae bacterium]
MKKTNELKVELEQFKASMKYTNVYDKDISSDEIYLKFVESASLYELEYQLLLAKSKDIVKKYNLGKYHIFSDDYTHQVFIFGYTKDTNQCIEIEVILNDLYQNDYITYHDENIDEALANIRGLGCWENIYLEDEK